MVRVLIVKDEAIQDMDDAVSFYDSIDEKLADRLIDELDDVLNHITYNPQHFQKRYKNVRIRFTNKFPFGIYYTMDKNAVIVHAVMHNKRNPKRMIKRLNP